MQILVMSDSHRNDYPVKRLLDKYATQVQMAVHLGDCAPDLLQFQADYPHITMVAVAGNSDSSPDLEKERVLSLNDSAPCRILLVHGDQHTVTWNYDRLAYYAQEKAVHACLFGHTHVPANLRVGSVFLFNPGSVSVPRDGSRAGYGLLQIDAEGNISGEVMEL